MNMLYIVLLSFVQVHLLAHYMSIKERSDLISGQIHCPRLLLNMCHDDRHQVHQVCWQQKCQTKCNLMEHKASM